VSTRFGMNTRKIGSRKYGGFPRSGNHFLQVALEKSFPNQQNYWCDHRISPIYSCGLYWTMVRNPSDCVISWNHFDLRDDKQTVSESFQWYISFMQALLDNRNNVFAIPFDEAIVDIAPFVRAGALRENTECVEIEHKTIVSELSERYPKNYLVGSRTVYDRELLDEVDENLVNDAVSIYGLVIGEMAASLQ